MTTTRLPHPESRRAPREDSVRVEALRGYVEAVAELGGDSAPLLAHVGISAQTLLATDAFISYRAMAELLEVTARVLECRDFGLRLAARQGGTAVLGPLDLAMRNTSTVGAAFRYCAEHLQVYSPVVKIALEENAEAGHHLMHVGILLEGLASKRQVVENALGSAHQAVLALSAGRFGAREVWFAHPSGMPLALYRRYLTGKIRFNAPFDAVVFRSSDFAQPIQNRDRHAFELAAKDIDLRFPAGAIDLVNRVRLLAAHRLQSDACTPQAVAEQLGVHSRTLQRQLKRAGTSFERLKDEARRESAVHYLQHSLLPITRIATLLGYSETAVLTRSCRRWFGCPPRVLREHGPR